MEEKHTASPEMQKFFEKLLDLKKFIKEIKNELPESAIITIISGRLDDIIKEGK